MNNLVPHIICGISFILILYLFCKNNKSKESFEDTPVHTEKIKTDFKGGTWDMIPEDSVKYQLSFLKLPTFIGIILGAGLCVGVGYVLALIIAGDKILQDESNQKIFRGIRKFILISLTFPYHIVFSIFPYGFIAGIVYLASGGTKDSGFWKFQKYYFLFWKDYTENKNENEQTYEPIERHN